VHVVDEEEYGSASIQRHDWTLAGTLCGYCAARGGELRFFVAAAGLYLFKGRNVARFPVNLQNKLISLQTGDKLALLVEDHNVGLNQIRIDFEYIVILNR
jgi:hypothetical protein